MTRWIPWTIVIVAAVTSWEVSAQPDEPGPYLISLRNVEPYTPDPGVRLDLPAREADANPRNVHVLVQLDAAVVARATDGRAREALRTLFAANPQDNPPLLIQRNLQRSTYEAVINRTLAEQLITPRGIAALDPEVRQFVRWIGTVPTESKIEAELRQGMYQSWGLGPNNTFRLLVTVHADEVDEAETTLRDILTRVRQQGQTVEPPRRYAHDTWVVLLPMNGLEALVAEDSVRSVAQGPRPFSPLNDTVRNATGIETAQGIVNPPSDPPAYGGLTGQGIAVAVMEGNGIDADHDDFWDHDIFGHRTVSRIQHHTGVPPTSKHGTHVTGTIAGNGYQSTRRNANEQLNGDPMTDHYKWRGMAPRATILSFENVLSGGDRQTQYDATVIAGADVSNDSHVHQSCLVYDTMTANVDSLVRGDLDFNGIEIPPRAAVWSAGNNGSYFRYCANFGYFGLTVASKNAIVVGGINANGTHYIESSLGPTYDGRLKPDVVAPGCSGLGIRSSATWEPDTDPERKGIANGYARACGTSTSAAVVTGAIALLLEKWRQEFGTSTGCLFTSSGECFPLPSTLKAVLIHGAKDVIDATPVRWIESPLAAVQAFKGPDYVTGYGSIDVAKSLALVDSVPASSRRIVEAVMWWPANVPDEYVVSVPPGAGSLRATLVWDDEEGSPGSSPTDKQLKNDLDLELISPTNVTHYPWVAPALTPNIVGSIHQEFDNAVAAQIAAATKGVDTLNNVEQVDVEAVALISGGDWTIRVKGGKLGPFKSQRYSLVADYSLGSGLVFPPVQGVRDPCIEIEWISGPGGLQVEIPPRGICVYVPLDPICRYILGCPGCPFGLCADMELRLSPIPDFLRVAVRRRDGTDVATDESGQRTRTLRWEPVPDEKYALVLEARPDTRPAGTYNIEVSLERSP
jgi:subtilisin family serine protease